MTCDVEHHSKQDSEDRGDSKNAEQIEVLQAEIAQEKEAKEELLDKQIELNSEIVKLTNQLALLKSHLETEKEAQKEASSGLQLAQKRHPLFLSRALGCLFSHLFVSCV